MIHFIKKRLLRKNIRLISNSIYFDRDWYLKENPDVAAAQIDPAEHYLKDGWKEKRRPSKEFDVNAYLSEFNSKKVAKMNPLLHYEKYGKKSYDKNCSKKESAICWETEEFPSDIKRIAVFASFSLDKKIADYVIYYLKELKKVCDIILFVTDSPLYPSELDKIRDYIVYANISRHKEYDFGSYKRGYLWALQTGLLKSAEELIFCNDSCYGPVFPFEKMFTTMNQKKLDFWGICANDEYCYHLQSYFLVFQKKVFSSHVFNDFMNSIQKESNVLQVILNYEVTLTDKLQNSGFKCDSYIPLIKDHNPYPYMYTHNLTLFPIFLLKKGCPLLKVKALKKDWCNYEGVEKTLDYVREINPTLYQFLPKLEIPKNISFSIIMPTYNRKKLVRKAIESVLSQTYQNFELIIVDDGSTDNTDDYIKCNYSQELKSGKIKYYKKINEGVCKARNYGLKQAQNEWIAYLDSDNILYPHFLETFARSISNNKKLTYYTAFSLMSNLSIVYQSFNFKRLIRANYIDLGVFVHHTSVYKKLGGFDENMTRLVDWDLIIRYCKKYTPISIQCPVLLYNDLDDHDRISNTNSYEKNLAYFRKKHKRFSLVKVTTMITTYNHEKYIRQAIESAISQTGGFEHEILISDDGSTDGTRAIIQEYVQKYPYLIRDISPDRNLGISGNMRHCFQEATGKYIAVLEGDDYWTAPHKLKKQMRFLEHHKRCSMVFSKIQLLNEKTQKISFLDRQKNLASKLTGKDFIKTPSLNLIANFSCCMFRTKYMKNLPDIMFAGRLNEISVSFYLEQKGKIGFISLPLSVYRQHEKGVWSGANKKSQLESGLKARQVALAVCAEKFKAPLKKIIDEKFINPLKELEANDGEK